MSIKIYVATNNEHKRAEIENILKGYSVHLIGDLLDKHGEKVQDIPETQETFHGNAQLKSEYYAKIVPLKGNEYILADDSGLMVDSLGGEPGVHSKRFAELQNDNTNQDQANNRKLLQIMAHMDAHAPAGIQRGCKYVCVISISGSDGEVASFSGEVAGEVGLEPQGSGGFGYDPIFILQGGKSMAEIPADHKNSISHRYKALQQAKMFLDSL